ncbi:MAG: DUF932 domain-containing protein [Gemmataceae bacterium]
MSQRFEYGTARINDFNVHSTITKGKVTASTVALGGQVFKANKRFWNSLHMRYGFTSNIFRYFSHQEVFDRINQVNPEDEIRYCVSYDEDDKGQLLAISSPTSAVINYDELQGLLKKYGAEEIKYANGVVTSRHKPRNAGTFDIAGDDFQNKFVLQAPIDGFGKPCVYLSLLRLVCSNGAIAMTPVFRSELNPGRSGGSTEYSLTRVLDGFNNEEGYDALSKRFDSASRSWASVNEVNRLYKTISRLSFKQSEAGKAKAKKNAEAIIGTDGVAEDGTKLNVFRSFNQMTGNLAEIYGLANMNALSAKRQRTLPTACTIYDLINFTSEVATHHVAPEDSRKLQAYLGDLISTEYDLEGTVEHFPNWKDFFIGNGETTSTLAGMS